MNAGPASSMGNSKTRRVPQSMVQYRDKKSTASVKTIDCIVIDDDAEESRAGLKRKQNGPETFETLEDDEVTFVCDMNLADTKPGPLSKKLSRLKLQNKPSDSVAKSSVSVGAASPCKGPAPKRKKKTLPNVKVIHIYDSKPLEDSSAVLVRNEDVVTASSPSSNSNMRLKKNNIKKQGNSQSRRKQSFPSTKSKDYSLGIKSTGEFVTSVKKNRINGPQHLLPENSLSVDTIDLIESDDECIKTEESDCERSIAGHVILKSSIEEDPLLTEIGSKKNCSVQTEFDDIPLPENVTLNKISCKPGKIITPSPTKHSDGLFKMQEGAHSVLTKQQEAPTKTARSSADSPLLAIPVPSISQECSTELKSDSLGVFPGYVIKSVIDILKTNPIAVVTMNNKMWGFTKTVINPEKVRIQSQYLGEFVNSIPPPLPAPAPNSAAEPNVNLMYSSLSNYDVIIENPKPACRTESMQAPSNTSESDTNYIPSSDNTPIRSDNILSENIEREPLLSLNDSTSSAPILSNSISKDLFDDIFVNLDNTEYPSLIDDAQISGRTISNSQNCEQSASDRTPPNEIAANSFEYIKDEIVKEEIDIESEILRLKNNKPLLGDQSKESTMNGTSKSSNLPSKVVSPILCVPDGGADPSNTVLDKAPESYSDSFESFCMKFCKDKFNVPNQNIKFKLYKNFK